MDAKQLWTQNNYGRKTTMDAKQLWTQNNYGRKISKHKNDADKKKLN